MIILIVMRFFLRSVRDETGIAPIVVVVLIASLLATLTITKSIKIPTANLPVLAENLGVGTTSPEFPTPTGNTGIGTSEPILASTPTPTPTPPTDTSLPTPAPEGSVTRHATNGTNCFDSDGNFPPYWPSGIKGYCQDSTSTYYDYCNPNGELVEYGCSGAIYDSTGDLSIASYIQTGCSKVTSYCANCGTPIPGTCPAYSQTLSAPTPTPAFPSDPSPTPFPISVAADTRLPVITIVSPAASSTVSGIVSIEVSATDNIGISKVSFYIDRSGGYGTKVALLGTVTQAPYKFVWDTTKEANAGYFLYAYAYDSWNNSVWKNWVITVSNVTTPTATPTPVPPTITPTPTPVDTIPPTVSITSPLAGSTVSGIVTIEAAASDNVGVAKVEFYAPDQSGTPLIATDTTAPYQAQWDTTKTTDGNKNIYAYAYDARFNSATTSTTVTVNNTSPTATPIPTNTPTPTPIPSDTTPPSSPTNLTTTAPSYNRVDLAWSASTDNVGVTGYWIVRNGITIASSSTTSFTDTTVSSATNYTYQVIAFDAAGNNSSTSTSVSVTTPSAPDTQAPTTPSSLTATPVSSSQINLSWNVSSDNVGVSGYEVFRNSIKITTVTGTSFGDTGLSASTTYTYFVRALDGAGNVSANSNVASATTQPIATTGNITGTVSSSAGGVIAGAKISTTVNSSKRTFYTNSQGAYTLTGLPPATYTLTFSARGYLNLKTSVNVAAGVTSVNNVTLIKR